MSLLKSAFDKVSLGSLFFQKPWVYDLWEVWNGYPRQVSHTDVVPSLLSSLSPDLGLSPFLLSVHFSEVLEFTYPCSLFTLHLSHSFSLFVVNVIMYLSLNLPS